MKFLDRHRLGGDHFFPFACPVLRTCMALTRPSVTYTKPGAKMAGRAVVKLCRKGQSLMSKRLSYNEIPLYMHMPRSTEC